MGQVRTAVGSVAGAMGRQQAVAILLRQRRWTKANALRGEAGREWLWYRDVGGRGGELVVSGDSRSSNASLGCAQIGIPTANHAETCANHLQM